jgi:predicted dienelactone hydrolase
MKLIGLFAAVILLIAPRAHAGSVGFVEVSLPNGAEAPLVVGIWYPTEAPASPQPLATYVQTVAPKGAVAGRRLPLIVISHGTGGWYDEHYDTALALARAGFVVAAVSHTDDTYLDQHKAPQVWRRPAHIHLLIDYMLTAWSDHARIDPERVGMFGFSAGGFTTLVVAGGVPDLSLVPAHCAAHPDFFECQLVKKYGGFSDATNHLPASTWVHDARVKAAVVAAPALGYAFGPDGLKGVRIPIQLWRAADDHLLPNPYYAEAVREDLPQRPEFHLVADADHFDFLAPCSERLRQQAPEICVSRPGFDRVAFHERFDAEVVQFFEQKLK